MRTWPASTFSLSGGWFGNRTEPDGFGQGLEILHIRPGLGWRPQPEAQAPKGCYVAGPACWTSSRRPWAWKDGTGARGPGPHPGACPLLASVGPGPPARSGPRFVSVRLSFGLLGGWQG